MLTPNKTAALTTSATLLMAESFGVTLASSAGFTLPSSTVARGVELFFSTSEPTERPSSWSASVARLPRFFLPLFPPSPGLRRDAATTVRSRPGAGRS
ncbi:hypothetical protein CFC21_000620 [Triticum aestivum]|uniref:Uncharacterized protein n=2 Tax=Triticum TaxID=4564 RepID=A0A9R0Q0F4_TRITD|nr:hypothetical protein CFC21_000620 [Triticum aestivum]VAH01335.1 unnamed protein product [Triticum turgidum subsp. durum]